MKRIVVTGLGVLASCGIGKDDFWKNSLSGKSYITSYDEFKNFKLNSRVKGSIDHFNYKNFNMTDEEANRMGRHTQLAMAAAMESIEDAKLSLDTIDKEHVGVCVANAIADTPYSEQQFLKIHTHFNKEYSKSLEDLIDPNLFAKAMFNCLSTEIAAKYGFKGHVFTMSTGCTSGIDAAGYSMEAIRNGEMNIMVCGASEAPLTCMTFASFDVIGATSKKNKFPEQASSPFDRTRDGFVLAEGCGILVFEEQEHALKRNAHIYAEVIGYATYNNAWHMTDLPEDGLALATTIKMALNDANVKPEEIDYINTHGSSTPQNDFFETQAFKKVFGERAYHIPISATKSITGHPLGAASAVELVQSCLVFENNKIPPTVNLNHPDPSCDLDYVPHHFREQKVNMLMRVASGFSGIHSVMILKRAT